MKLLRYIFVIMLLVSCKQEPTESTCHILYKNDKQGNTLLGSKQDLIAAIRAGADIKIGWGSKGKNHSIEHLSVPIWLAVLDEKEVIAHLDPQMLSTVDWDMLSANYKDSTKLKEEWRVVITTKGEFDAVWYDKQNSTLIQRRPQRHVMTWFSKQHTKQVTPLFAK